MAILDNEPIPAYGIASLGLASPDALGPSGWTILFSTDSWPEGTMPHAGGMEAHGWSMSAEEYNKDPGLYVPEHYSPFVLQGLAQTEDGVKPVSLTIANAPSSEALISAPLTPVNAFSGFGVLPSSSLSYVPTGWTEDGQRIAHLDYTPGCDIPLLTPVGTGQQPLPSIHDNGTIFGHAPEYIHAIRFVFDALPDHAHVSIPGAIMDGKTWVLDRAHFPSQSAFEVSLSRAAVTMPSLWSGQAHATVEVQGPNGWGDAGAISVLSADQSHPISVHTLLLDGAAPMSMMADAISETGDVRHASWSVSSDPSVMDRTSQTAAAAAFLQSLGEATSIGGGYAVSLSVLTDDGRMAPSGMGGATPYILNPEDAGHHLSLPSGVTVLAEGRVLPMNQEGHYVLPSDQDRVTIEGADGHTPFITAQIVAEPIDALPIVETPAEYAAKNVIGHGLG